MNEWVSENIGIVIAAGAAFVSLLSLLVSIVTLAIHRNHNYMSVKPIAHFSKGDYEDCLFVKLKNYGTGPLIVKSFDVIRPNGDKSKRVIEAIGDIAADVVWETFTDSIDGRALAPGAEFVLLKGNFDGDEMEMRQAIRQELSKLELRVSFQDVYERDQEPISERLTWFSR